MDKRCGYCGKKCSLEKDFCIPQDSVYICKSCYEWQNKVSNLEAKLAESENQCQECKHLNKKIELNIKNKLMNENKELIQQLAEERKKVCEQIYNLFTNDIMWSTMRDWWLNNGTCRELKLVLDAVENGMENKKNY